jgi:hypothetical protein
MAGRIPKPYKNDVAVDNGLMKYPVQGQFQKTEIGARPSGMPKSISADGMSLDHVGSNPTGK